jgi:ribosomal protein S18 acetylase RimI-like enzyme
MGMLNLEIRYITESDDRLAISKVYEESWKYAYKGIVPQDYLDSIPEGQWASHMEQEDRKNLVMVQNGIIIGTSGFGKSRMEEMDGFGEIISLYFLTDYMGNGYGRLLLQTVVEELKKMGFDKVFLWVLEENRNARDFYEKCGFVQTERCLFSDIGGKKLKEVQYCYQDI